MSRSFNVSANFVQRVSAWLLIMVGFWAFSCYFAPAQGNDPLVPKLSLPELEYDAGEVDEGTEIKHSFIIKNDGKAPLNITNVHTSCGCTVLNLKNSLVPPGGSVELGVTLDTAMKLGNVRKQIDIYTDDPAAPMTSVYLKTVVNNPHIGMTKEDKAKIFMGRCAVCHVQAGVGKLGDALYHADCAMCHGNDAMGREAPSLVPRNYADSNVVSRVRKYIADGSPEHPSMPGFATEKGGPLTAAEIDSIIDYLKSRSDRFNIKWDQK